MDDELKVSIIVPIYNSERFLPRCIESILGQKYTNIQLILVDDGSTDASADICRQYKKCDSRICIVSKENGGISSARNAGLNVACGDAIMWVDSDDWIGADWVNTYVNKLIENDVDVVIAGRRQCILSGTEILRSYLLDAIEHTMWISCARRAVYQGLHFSNYTIGEDALFLCSLLHQAQTCYCMNRPSGYSYTANPQSVSRAKKLANKVDWPKRGQAELNFVRAVEPSLYHHAEFDVMRGASHIYRDVHKMRVSSDEIETKRQLLRQLRAFIRQGLLHLPLRDFSSWNYRQIAVTLRNIFF